MDIVFSFGPDDSGVVQSLVDDFNQQHPAINVIYREMPGNTDLYLEELRRMFERSGDDVDVIGGDVIWPAEFASNGWIADLSGRFPQAEQNAFLGPTIDANTHQGTIWGVPWFTDVGLLYYRKDLLDQAGEVAPKTWDELKGIALRVKQASRLQHGYVFQGADYEGGVCNGLEYIWTHSGDVLDSTGALIINSNEAKKGLRTERSMVTDGVAPQDVHTFTEEESTVRFLDGQAVFCRNWAFLFGIVSEPGEPLSRDQVGVVELPRDQGVQQGGGCLGGWNMFINAASAHQDEAWQFIDFMTAQAQQRTLAIGASYLPTRRALYQEQQLLNQVPILRLSSTALNNATPRPIHPRYLEMSEKMAVQFNLSLKGDVPPARAIETLRRELSIIVGP